MHDRLKRWWRTRHLSEGQTIAERTDARGCVTKLVWRNGRLECLCVHACLATYESCEFSDKTEAEWLDEMDLPREENDPIGAAIVEELRVHYPPTPPLEDDPVAKRLGIDTDHWCNDTGIV